MSAASAEPITASPRLLGRRQAEIVERIIDAAAAEARERGYDGLTVRSAARRAGVAAATAYTYFASKDHLLAEVLWRRMSALPPARLEPSQPAAARVAAAMRAQALFMADDPDVASAGTTALLGSGPDVKALRARIGSAMHARVAEALGEGADPATVRVLDLACFGAMLAAGLGHIEFEDVPGALDEVAGVVLKDAS